MGSSKMQKVRVSVPLIILVAFVFAGTDSVSTPLSAPMPLRTLRQSIIHPVPQLAALKRRTPTQPNIKALRGGSPDDAEDMYTGQGSPDGSDQQPPPQQQGLSVLTVLSALARTAQEHPRETGYVIAAGTAGYAAYKVRRRYRAGWPFPLQTSSPLVTLLRPRTPYMKQNYFPKVLKADFNGREAITRDLDDPPPGFKVIKERIKVGVGKEDYEMAVRAMRAWRMIDSVEWLSAHSSKDARAKDSESLAIVARTAAGYVVGPWRLSYAQEGAMPEKKGRSAGLRSVVGLSTLSGNCFEGEVRFSVEWLQEEDDRDSEGAVWFEAFSVVRRARGASFVAAPLFYKLHQQGMEGMVAKMEELVQTEKDMLALRRLRQSETDVNSRGAKAEIAAKALQKQKDLEEFKAKEWHRNNSGYGGGHGGFKPETMSRMRKMQHD